MGWIRTGPSGRPSYSDSKNKRTAVVFKALDANGNMLTHLPVGFGALRLRSLKLSFNRLETLRHEVFRPALKGTLRQLWLSNNNLLQLPDSLIEASERSTYRERERGVRDPLPRFFLNVSDFALLFLHMGGKH